VSSWVPCPRSYATTCCSGPSLSNFAFKIYSFSNTFCLAIRQFALLMPSVNELVHILGIGFLLSNMSWLLLLYMQFWCWDLWIVRK
jgi:hypothetical protein